METHRLDDDKESLCPAKPVGTGLFPSAAAILKKDSEEQHSDIEWQGGSTADNNDLETLRLTLPTSAMDAIIAAQNPDLPIQQDVSIAEKRDESDGSSVGKKSSPNTSDEDIALQKEKERHTSKRKKKKHKHKHKHKKLKRHHRNESPPPMSDKDDGVKIPVGAVFLDDIRGLRPEHAFHIDRKKNKDLWHYESVSSRHIAKYKNISRTCLGASHLRLNRKGADKNKKAAELTRYFGKVGARQVYGKGSALTAKGSNPTSFSSAGDGLDFIPFPKPTTKTCSESEPRGSYSCLDEATSLYVHGRGTDYSSNADGTVDKDFVMDEIFERVRSFNQRTRDEPGNVPLWLEFVAFQDVVAQREKGGGSGLLSETVKLKEVYRPTRSVIDKKLAILEKALESNPSSLELKLAQLGLYQDIWEREKVEKAWEDLLFVHSGNVDLWQEYLAKQQCSRLQGFTVSGAAKHFHKCFQTLTAIMDGQVKVIQKTTDMEEKIISLFSQYCDFLHFSGYTERAVSSYQALIEFNLYCPPSLNLTPTRERAGQFEEFWESSVPRFGEAGALGWAKWAEGKSKGVAQQPVFMPDVSTEEQEDTIILQQLPRSHTWVKMEKLREGAHFLPWRPDTSKGETDDSAEDPERLVLFDDVSPILFRLSKSESCVRVVCLFLKFLGMRSAVLDEKIQHWEQEAGSLKFEQYSKANLHQCLELSRCYSTIDSDTGGSLDKPILDFVSKVLVQAEAYFSLQSRTLFTLLRLDCEVLRHGTGKLSEVAAAGVKDIKKFGKGLLKESQNRNNLLVWDTYVRLLWTCSSDKIGETVSMVETAMAMFMGPHNAAADVDKKHGLCRLCLTYCQILLNFEPLEHVETTLRHSAPSREDKQQAMACLGALVENKVFKPGSLGEVTPGYILKVRSLYQKSIADSVGKPGKARLSSGCAFLCALADCYVLFEFCASNFVSANGIFESTRQSILKLEQEESQLYRSYYCATRKNLYLHQLSFIINVMHISIVPRSFLRETITSGLNEFPESPHLHAAFIKLEAGSHIAGRLRQFYDRSLRNATALTVPLFAVVSELARHNRIVAANSSTEPCLSESSALGHDTGIKHRLRSVFEAALAHTTSSHCPLLWRLYLNFEFKFGAESKAKGILYRALQCCPWAKCIFIDGITLFGDAELQEMTDLMTEEEIRVRMPLEEVDLLRTAEKEESEDGGSVKEEPHSESEDEKPAAVDSS